MSFASPLWLWALTGLVVPLAIHLLSRGRRQRVAIGSIRHLAGSQSRALRRIQLSGWLQLLVRMSILAVLALALAGPRWALTGAGSEPAGWVLIDPEVVAGAAGLEEADPEFAHRLESAEESASSVRFLAPGLPKLAEGEISGGDPIDAWSLLREADGRAPAGVLLSVFSMDRVALLRGRRPALARPVDWWVLADDQPNRWIQRASSAVAGERVVTIGESQADGSLFHTVTWPDGGLPPGEIRIDSDLEVLELTAGGSRTEDDRTPIPGESRPLRIALSAAPDRETDSWYLHQAVETIGAYLGREVVWVEEGEVGVDLQVLLGQKAVAEAAQVPVLTDGETIAEDCQGRVYSALAAGDPWLHLERCSTRWGSDSSVGWWIDGWGRPFLSRRVEPPARQYELQGRFNASWSSLVSSPTLPRLLVDLVAPDDAVSGGVGSLQSDRRRTTGEERRPVFVESKSGGPIRYSAVPGSLAWILWPLLFALERWISRRVA